MSHMQTMAHNDALYESDHPIPARSSADLKARSEQSRKALKLLEEANKQQANLLELREQQPLAVKLGVRPPAKVLGELRVRS